METKTYNWDLPVAKLTVNFGFKYSNTFADNLICAYPLSKKMVLKGNPWNHTLVLCKGKEEEPWFSEEEENAVYLFNE